MQDAHQSIIIVTHFKQRIQRYALLPSSLLTNKNKKLKSSLVLLSIKRVTHFHDHFHFQRVPFISIFITALTGLTRLWTMSHQPFRNMGSESYEGQPVLHSAEITQRAPFTINALGCFRANVYFVIAPTAVQPGHNGHPRLCHARPQPARCASAAGRGRTRANWKWTPMYRRASRPPIKAKCFLRHNQQRAGCMYGKPG